MSPHYVSPSSSTNTSAVSLDALTGAQQIHDHHEATATPLPALVSLDRFAEDHGTINRVKKILSTSSRGVPAQYENAWHWAGDWVAKNGVTLPPDTTQLRSLRNWFCYQVNMFKKDRLSDVSRELLDHYKIDLSLYRAPNTGRGTLLDDEAMIQVMLMLHTNTGSFNPQADAEPVLLEWQRRLIERYTARGTSARMRAIESKLPGFRFAFWLRPGKFPVPTSHHSWWTTVQAFRLATVNCPAFRGVLDKSTPMHLSAWATEQISAAAAGKLSPRQRGELLSIGILSNHEHKRSTQREEALRVARVAAGATETSGQRDRDLNSFLGTALLVRLLRRNASLTDIYSTLGITPHQYSRLLTPLRPIHGPLIELGELNRLNRARQLYHDNSLKFDTARALSDLPESIFEGIPKLACQRLKSLVGLLFEAREILRSTNVRQTIVKRDATLTAQ